MAFGELGTAISTGVGALATGLETLGTGIVEGVQGAWQGLGELINPAVASGAKDASGVAADAASSAYTGLGNQALNLTNSGAVPAAMNFSTVANNNTLGAGLGDLNLITGAGGAVKEGAQSAGMMDFLKEFGPGMYQAYNTQQANEDNSRITDAKLDEYAYNKGVNQKYEKYADEDRVSRAAAARAYNNA